MNPASTALDTKLSPAVQQGRRVPWLALGTGLGVMIVLFAIWPYQHWQFARRGSVLEGWYKVLNLADNAEWQFCLFVPFIVGFLVYRVRDTLARLPVAGSWSGAVVLGLAVICYWLGYKVDTGYLGFAALQLAVAGLVLLLAGTAWMRALFFPWLFLAFAWPFFPLDSLLAAKLKIPTAQIACQILSWTGVEVVREGSTVQSAANFATGLKQGASFTFDVSDSCSGMRSLYALMMVGVLYGYLSLRRTGPRLLLAASTIPLAVAGNVFRLLMLAVGSLWFGQEFAVGRQVDGKQVDSAFHLLAGFMVFGVALAGMFGLATLLEGRHWNRLRLWAGAEGDAVTSGRTEERFNAALVKSGAAVALALVGIVLCWTTPTAPTLAEPGLKMELPAMVDSYQSMQLTMTAKEASIFEPGVKLDRRVYGNGQRQILGTLVMSGPAKKSLHQPDICLPNQGWIIASTQEVPIAMKDGRFKKVTLMRVFRDQETAPGVRVRSWGLNIFWYEGSSGVSTPSYLMSNFISYRDAILFNLNHRWGMASYFMRLPDKELGVVDTDPLGELQSMDALMQFVSASLPAIVVD
ncbi:exosortase/archaeosortase family protein [Verrucomicrobium sp. BvORR034]|uniref:exosortase/archaeosortase family protein n=1 Tax=Verrucomicrobium sp. BvORR034 TaxID=1396418 RepID=UPI000679E601|nr:exosortase/archaeosortase family protein [Verrucomicrobium sp. BvORR034]